MILKNYFVKKMLINFFQLFSLIHEVNKRKKSKNKKWFFYFVSFRNYKEIFFVLFWGKFIFCYQNIYKVLTSTKKHVKIVEIKFHFFFKKN